MEVTHDLYSSSILTIVYVWTGRVVYVQYLLTDMIHFIQLYSKGPIILWHALSAGDIVLTTPYSVQHS